MKAILYITLLFFCESAFAQKTLFTKYKVPLFKGQPAPLKLKSNPTAQQFRTAISNIYYSKKNTPVFYEQTGQNFAGHYCFVYWGCGSPCQSSAVVDLKTGIVYDGPTGASGYQFMKNSRLLIVNPDASQRDMAIMKPEHWIWDDSDKTFHQLTSPK